MNMNENSEVEVADLSARYYAFFDCVSTGSHEETLSLFAQCERMREEAEKNPIKGLGEVLSRNVLMGSWAHKANLQAWSFPEGHPEQLKKLQLRDALLYYSVLK